MGWILPGGIAAGVVAIFIAGWILGGRNRESKIRIKGLEDVNAHYGKMAEDFKQVDQVIDRAGSRLRGRRVRPLPKGN